jgi:hypothetical protein
MDRFPERAMAASVWAIAGVVLLAVLVGASLPVLAQLRATLRAAERFFDTTGPRAGRCLEEVTSAATHSNEASRSSGRLASALASAVVPALLAAVDALRGRSPEVEGAEGLQVAREAQVQEEEVPS